MKKDKSQPAFSAPDRSNVPGTIVILAAALLVFGLLMGWMYSVGMIELPGFLTRMFGLGREDLPDDLPWNAEELAGIIRRGETSEGEMLSWDVTYENLRGALLTADDPENLYLSAEVTRYDTLNAAAAQENTRRVLMRKSGSRFRVELYSDDSFAKRTALMVSDGFQTAYLDDLTGEKKVYPRANDFSPETEAGIPSVEGLLDILAQVFPVSQDESPAEGYADCTLTLLDTEDGYVYYIAYLDESLGFFDEYFLSLENRLILYAASSVGGRPIYSYEVSGVSTAPPNAAAEAFYQLP